MTEIGNTWSFEGLPHIYLITSDYKIKSLGFYDPDWSRDTEFSYLPGKFTKPDGTPYDTAYKDKQAIVVTFKHPIFGNYPGLRNLTGHFHYKYIVSTSSIRPHDVLRADPDTQDIYIFADLARSPSKTELRGDNTQETLYEITPHLSAEELAQLPKSIKFITKIKERLHEVENKNWDLEAQLVIEHTIATNATGTVFMLQEHMNTLMKSYQIIYDKVISLQLSVRKKISDVILKVEGENYLMAPWDSLKEEDITQTAGTLQAEIRALAAMTKLNGKLTEAQKYQLVMQTANVVGLDYMRKCLLGIEEYKVSTPTGMKSLTMSKEPSPIELFLHYGDLYENGQITPEEYKEAISRLNSQIRETYKRTDISPNAATQKLKVDFIKKIAPELQVPDATR